MQAQAAPPKIGAPGKKGLPKVPKTSG